MVKATPIDNREKTWTCTHYPSWYVQLEPNSWYLYFYIIHFSINKWKNPSTSVINVFSNESKKDIINIYRQTNHPSIIESPPSQHRHQCSEKSSTIEHNAIKITQLIFYWIRGPLLISVWSHAGAHQHGAII
jgi:pullulanase/glycogen debranching enzyme